MTFCGIDDDGDTRYCKSSYYCCDTANHLCCLSTIEWYSWWWVWLVFFVVIVTISLCSYYCRRRYMAQHTRIARGPQPVQCGVATMATSNMPMYTPPAQPGAPPTMYTGPPPYPGYPAQMSPPYSIQMGLSQNNIPGYASVPPPYESVHS